MGKVAKGPRTAVRRDIDLNYMKGAHSWQERVVKYAELCTLEYYLSKYEEAFEGGAEKIKEFQHAMDDDIERGEKLKQELVRDGWGENEIKFAMQKEETQYRRAISISSRASENKTSVREVVQESEFQKIEAKQSLIAYIGDIIKKRRKVEMENRTIQQERMKNNRLKRAKQQQPRSLVGNAIAPDMAEKRLQALQKIRELNALRKSQRGDLNMY